VNYTTDVELDTSGLDADDARMAEQLPDTQIVATADVQARTAALQQVFAHLGPEDCSAHITMATEQLVRSPEDNRLITAWRDGRITAAALAQVQPGRTALIWPPPVDAQTSAMGMNDARHILEEAYDWIVSRRAVLAQILLTEADASRRGLLERVGFHHLVDLIYLGCVVDPAPHEPPVGPLRFDCYSPDHHTRFAQVVERTYESTQDCPELNDVRRIDDVLSGYRAVGRFRPEQWLLVRHGDSDAGCLILMDHPEHGNLELVYMGVLPAWRGRGLGTMLLDRAIWLAGRLGRERLVLAVDARNAPAIRVYTAAGLRAWERRVVYSRGVEQPF